MGCSRETRQARPLVLSQESSPTDKIEILRRQVDVGEAIEAGRLVEEAVEELDRRIDARPSILGTDLAGMFRLENQRRQRQARRPTPARIVRIAQLVDDFAERYMQVSGLADGQMVRDWGPSLRSGDLATHDLYRELKSVVGDLRREQTQLTLLQMRTR